jgi:hypothetical protein
MGLKEEIYNFTQTSGMAIVGDHTGIVTFFNLARANVNSDNTSLQQENLVKWASNGRYSKLVEGQSTGNHSSKSKCYTIVDVMRNFTSINVSDKLMSGIVTDLLQDGVLNSGDWNAFNRILVKNPSSYAENLFGRFITLDEVSGALNN